MNANNRMHMASMLDDRMKRLKSAPKSSAAQRDASHIKTHIIEAILPEDSKPELTKTFIESVFPRIGGRQFGAIFLATSKDDTVTTIQTAIAGETIVAYLDFTNPRFWLLHSMSDSAILDRLVSHWIDDLPELDRAWFPVGLLDLYSQLGTLRGIGLEYNNGWLRKDEPGKDDLNVFKMQLRSKHAARVLATMRSPHGEPHTARLAKVVVEKFNSISDIKYDGRITGHGKSFSDHLAFTSTVLDTYAAQVRLVESQYSIHGSTESGRMVLSGESIAFDLPEPIDDLPAFCDGMFSASAPFRLWGDPIRLSEGFFRVQALDLHSAKTLAFELTPSFIRVYLPRGSCGNSILRLYTNLQARYDALVKVVNGNGESVFGF